MRRPALPLLLAVAAFAATPSLALDYRVRLYGAAAYVEPSTGFEPTQRPPTTDPLRVANAWGYELGFELKTAKLVGLELAYSDTTHDVPYLFLPPPGYASGTATIRLTPILVSVNFHVVRTKTLSWWLGPTVSYALTTDLHSDNARIPSDPLQGSLGYGVSTGVIVSVVKPLAFQAGVRWIKLSWTELGASCGAEGGCNYNQARGLDANLLIVHVGLALRFGSGVAPVPQEKRADTQD